MFFRFDLKKKLPSYYTESNTKTLLRFLLSLAWKYKWNSLGVLFLQIILLTLGLVGLRFMGVGVDFIRQHIAPSANPKPLTIAGWPLPDFGNVYLTLLFVTGAILLMAVLRGVLNYLYTISVNAFVQCKIVVDLRTQVFEKMQRLSFRFFDANASASIINRVTGDVQSVRAFIDGVLIPCVVLVLSLVVYLVYMLRISPLLTIVCLLPSPFLWFASSRFSKFMRPRYRKVRQLYDDLVLVLTEHLTGMSVVKGYAIEDIQEKKFKTANDAVLNEQQDIFKSVSRFNPIIGFISQLSTVLLFGFGGWLVVLHETRGASVGITVGDLLVFSALIQQFSGQIANIANIANSIQQSLIAAHRVYEVLSAPVEIESRELALAPTVFRGRIDFESVTFGYSPADPILKNLSFTIEPGECVAILGATGSGKSTILSLIPRFYDPNQGLVRVDSKDLRDLHVESLRRAIGVVFQESFLFSTTIRANIAFGNPDASDEQIFAAAKIAAVDTFVHQLPNGYDTILHEGGANLSGGQRQRIAIARAILQNPAILLLDDPTAAIDAHTEHEILSSIESAMKGRTTLIVTHRLSTLRRANRILVLENGNIAEIGTHDELFAKRGLYHMIVSHQSHGAVTPA